MKYQIIKELMMQNMQSLFTEQKLRFSLFDAYNFQIEKEINGAVCTVYFDKITVKDGTQYRGGGMGILFVNVEKIVFPLIIKHELWKEDFSDPPKKSYGTMGNYDTTEKLQNIRTKFGGVTISDEEDVERYCKELTDYLLNYVLPWFQEYSDLMNANALINRMSDTESANWFSPPHMLRKIVIKKLCNDSSYDTYLKFWKDRFESVSELENGKYLSYLNAILDLQKQLDLS